ncbi:MAG: hypothetical protein LAT62_15275 [Natronospirillum sp.]|uniref:hypothetical protein n=1 Tax=Natronospirillum sp. TaxID=2812955 RepID=UPI0025DEEF83|nr:hypothetical protein [Natronospirillum sp.]MCH8553299.1 hypothetical protein [Natronospirillum sp.]
MALQTRWKRVKALTADMQEKIIAEPDRVSDIWVERQQILEDLLSESRLSSLSTEDLNWLRDAVESLQTEEQRFLATLNEAQLEIIDVLRKQQGDARAVKAYKTQQDM